jgi:hypothetical protein
MDIRTTAAAGLVLQLASRAMGSEPERYASLQAARALAAVQLQSGQMPPTARLLPRPGSRVESVGIVPDRGPTCAALAMMLLVIDANRDKPDTFVVAAATRAATWLARQTTGAGGWQAAYPPNADLKARRIIRLEAPGYRDSTFALLLASNLLARREYSLTVDRCVDQLLRLRIRADGATGVGLWAPAATLGGDILTDVPELLPGVDLLATRYAMETLLADRVVADRTNLDKELLAAMAAIAQLPKTAGHFPRRYELFPSSAATQPTGAETRPWSSDVFDEQQLLQILRDVRLTQTAGPKTWTEPKANGLVLTDRLAMTLCGLTAGPFEPLGPTTPLPPGAPPAVDDAWQAYAATQFAK